MCACEMENEKVLNSKENSAERNCECLSIFRCTASQGLVAVDNHKFHSSEQYSSIYSIGQNISKPTIKIFYCTRTRSLCQWLPPLLASSKADNRWHNKCNKSTQSVYLLALLATGSVLRWFLSSTKPPQSRISNFVKKNCSTTSLPSSAHEVPIS